MYNKYMKNLSIHEIEKQFYELYDLRACSFTDLKTMVNDTFMVSTGGKKYALKFYHIPYRTEKEVRWELDLLLHLSTNGAPIAKPVFGKNGYLQKFILNGHERIALLFEWADGEKPQPCIETYVLLGKAAGQIHRAADSFAFPKDREIYNLQLLIDEQLERMEKLLKEVKQYDILRQLTDRLKLFVEEQTLDEGVCHMDLTLDNIHISDDTITVFDFDSAGFSWRALEPYSVLTYKKEYFDAWLKGYRSIRSFSEADEKAVYAFAIIGEIRNVTWKLGLANSSRGEPLLHTEDLPKVVNRWLEWEQTYL